MMTQSALYLFVERPYDVGDLLSLPPTGALARVKKASETRDAKQRGWQQQHSGWLRVCMYSSRVHQHHLSRRPLLLMQLLMLLMLHTSQLGPQIDLMYTQLTRGTGEHVLFPNATMRSLQLVNISRSAPKSEGFSWLLDYDVPDEVWRTH